MGCHLEHAVCAGVDDERILLHRLLTVVPQHLGAGIRLIAQHFMAGLALELLDQRIRESLREGGQRLGADHTCDLPMANGGILAHALLLQACKGAGGGRVLLPYSHAVQVKETQLAQVGAIKVGVAGNGRQGIGPLVPKSSSVRLCANAKAVQND